MKRFVACVMLLLLFCGCDMIAVTSNEADLNEITGDTTHVRINGELSGKESIIADKDLTFASESKDVEVKVTADEKMEDGYVVNYSWTLKISDPSAGTRFQYRYANFESLEFIKSEDYEGSAEKNCVMAVDKEDHSIIAWEISEAKAHDANGNPVKCWYEIEDDGTTLTECLEYNEDTKFPVVMNLHPHAHRCVL